MRGPDHLIEFTHGTRIPVILWRALLHLERLTPIRRRGR